MVTRAADMVLVVVGVRPETALAAGAGAGLGVKGAIAVDPGMRTSLPDVFAAGDCVITRHRLLGVTYLPLGTTAHKQGRVAGENALGDSLAHLVRAVNSRLGKLAARPEHPRRPRCRARGQRVAPWSPGSLCRRGTSVP